MSRRGKFFGLGKQQSVRFAPPPGPPPNWQEWNAPPGPPPGPPSMPEPSSLRSRGSKKAPRPQESTSQILSHEDEVKRIAKACKTARGYAQVLQESLLYTSAEEAKENSLVQEFLKKCRNAQEQISSNIPWATLQAERAQSSQYGESEEERLLADLLAANEVLLDALKMYDDLGSQEKRNRERAEQKMRTLEAITSYSPTLAEEDLVDHIFGLLDPQNSGSIRPDAAHDLFLGANLPYDTLQSIWEIANVEENPTYGKYCIGIAVRLVGHIQNGAEFSEELVTRAGPIAVIEGLDRTSTGYAQNPPQLPTRSRRTSSAPLAGPSRPSLPHALSDLPPLTEKDRQKFMTIFQRSGPESGVLSGPRAREVLVKSRLPTDVLGEIWELADIQSKGHLDAPAFTIAMYLVQACMSGQLTTIPPVLPQALYDQAALSAPHAVLDAHYGSSAPSPPRGSPGIPPPAIMPVAGPSTSTSNEPSLIDLDEEAQGLPPPMSMPIATLGGRPLEPITVAMPPPGLPTPRSPLSPSASTIFRINTTPGPSRPLSVVHAEPDVIPEGWTWDVSPSDKASSDKFFDTLDPWKQGFIEGDAAVGFLSKSKLPTAELAHVWDLADINCDGRLTKEEFAIAMFLVRGKLAGREIPAELPPSLVPPPNLPEVVLAPSTPPQAHTAPVTPVIPAQETERSSTPPPPYDENLGVAEAAA